MDKTKFSKVYFIKVFITSILLLTPSFLYSQKHKLEKRIYLIDVTVSMEGKGAVSTPNIFSKVKEKLINTIDEVEDLNTEIVIIPFTNKTHTIIRDYSRNKDNLFSAINSLRILPGDTNISDAWQSGIEEIDSTKINYLFMLTDGLHNFGPSKEVLYSQLRNWGDFAKDKYYFAFYLMLTPEAKEQELFNIVDKSDQMWLIESLDVNALFYKTSLSQKVNIYNNKTVKIEFDSNSQKETHEKISLNLKLENNPYYKISNIRSFINKGNYVLFDIIELKPISEIPLEMILKLSFINESDDFSLVYFTPNIIKLKIQNRGLRSMTIKGLKK